MAHAGNGIRVVFVNRRIGKDALAGPANIRQTTEALLERAQYSRRPEMNSKNAAFSSPK